MNTTEEADTKGVAAALPLLLDEEAPESVPREEEVDIDETDEEDWAQAGDAWAPSTDGETWSATQAATGRPDSRWAVIQGWRRISSMDILSTGLSLRHRFTRSWHSWDRRVLNLISALQICSSCSNGMSPQTMS